MFAGQGRSLLRRSEIALAFASTNNADSANLRVGDLLILSQRRTNPPPGGFPTIIAGFTELTAVGYGIGGDSVSGSISCITVTAAQIGATFTQFQRMWALRDATGPLRILNTIRSTTGSYDASALPSPVGFAYTVSRSNSTSPGTIGTVSDETGDETYNQTYTVGAANVAIRLGFWRGNRPQKSYTLTVGTNPGDDVNRRFHAIYRAV